VAVVAINDGKVDVSAHRFKLLPDENVVNSFYFTKAGKSSRLLGNMIKKYFF